MAQVPMRMPPGNGGHLLQASSGPQHHLQPGNGQHHHGQAGAGSHRGMHHMQQQQGSNTTAAAHHLQANPGASHHHMQQNPGLAQHHLHQQSSAPHQHHMQQQSPGGAPQHHVQSSSGPSQHIIQQRSLPTHQSMQGVGGHTHGSHPSSNHVMLSQYGHPPTSLPGVIVSVTSGGPLPPPMQHITINNGGSHGPANISHIGQIESNGGYNRSAPQQHQHQGGSGGLPTQFVRPPPVVHNSRGLLLDQDESDNTKEKTPMCLVNELARFNKVQHQYKLTDESGPAHKKSFTVCLKIGDKAEEEYVASGPSIKKAQHAAAAMALEKTQFKHPTPKVKHTKSVNVTPTVELNALAMKLGEQTTYTFLEPGRASQIPPNAKTARSGPFPPVFCVQLKVGNNEFIGNGATAQAARHSAASLALRALREVPESDAKSKLDPTSVPFVPENVAVKSESEYDDLKSPISLVHEIALKRNLSVSFAVVKETGPPHMRMFITRCSVGNTVCDGEGNGKKVSKKNAAEMMLVELRKLAPVANVAVPKSRKQSTTKKKSKNLIKVENKDSSDPKQAVNPISRLIQIQQAKKEKEPVYTLIGERGMPRRREFFMKVTVGSISAMGSGTNKKVAKRAATEALLQITGYLKPSAVPGKPNLKPPGEVSDKTKKLTFEEDLKGEETGSSGSCGRQLVPGLLYLDDKASKNGKMVGVAGGGTQNGNNSQTQAATIAKELLDAGTSPTAVQLAKKAGSSLPAPLPKLPTSGQGVSSKEQLAYLSQILGFTVTYNDFPKKGEYLTLVSLSTNPPQVCHGSGQSLESSHNNAAYTALKTLADNGLDDITDQDNGRRQL